MFTASHRAPSAFFIARSEVTGAGSQRQSLNYMGRELPQEVRDAARLPFPREPPGTSRRPSTS